MAQVLNRAKPLSHDLASAAAGAIAAWSTVLLALCLLISAPFDVLRVVSIYVKVVSVYRKPKLTVHVMPLPAGRRRAQAARLVYILPPKKKLKAAGGAS
jgi:hypothetical protein